MKVAIIITVVFSILSFLFCFDRSNESYQLIFLLPLTYGILTLFFSKHLIRLKNSIVFILVFIQILIRYVVIPPMVASNEKMLAGSQSIFANYSIFSMMLELIFVFIVFSCISRLQTQKFNIRVKKIIPVKGHIVLFGVLVICIVYIIASGYLNKVNFIWELEAYVEKSLRNEDIEINTLGALLFNPVKIIISLLFISKIVSYEKMKSSYKVILLLLVIAFNGIFIIGVSRFSIILSVLPLFVIVLILFYEHRKKLIIGLMSGLFPVMLITSIAKFTRSENTVEVDSFFNASSLNAYFAGVGNVSAGYESYYNTQEKSNVLFFLNDIFQNVPIFSKYTKGKYKSNNHFNESIYGHTDYQTQIVPLSTAGLYHFDVFGIFFYPVVILFLAFYFERKFYKSSFLGYKYAFVTLSISLSLIFMFNIGSISSTIFKTYIFLYIPLAIIYRYQTNILNK